MCRLTDFERKLLTIIQNNNQRGVYPTLNDVAGRTNHEPDELISLLAFLQQQEWIQIKDGKMKMLKRVY